MRKQRHQLHENPRLWLLIGLLSGLSAFAGTAMAKEYDDLRADSLCIGANCTAANDAEIRLEANVVRLRFLDSTADNPIDEKIGNSWSLLANDPSGHTDAQTYFSFILRSLDETPYDGRNNIDGRHVLRFGPKDSENGSAKAVAIGLNSEFEEQVVSLGRKGVERRLVHVAAGLQETDALIKRQLEDGLLGSVGGVSDRLDELEDEVAKLERQVGIDGGGGSGGGGSGGGRSGGGGGGFIGVPTLVFLAALLGTAWRHRTVAA